MRSVQYQRGRGAAVGGAGWRDWHGLVFNLEASVVPYEFH
jgi:hypothetical protein